MSGLIKILWTSIGIWVDCSIGDMDSNGFLSSCKFSRSSRLW